MLFIALVAVLLLLAFALTKAEKASPLLPSCSASSPSLPASSTESAPWISAER